MVVAAGLHIGLQSLVNGGIQPKLLIIDDGWQSTDVDAELRQPVSKKLRLSEPMPELDETESEFIEAELEMLSMTARDVSAGSSLGKGSLKNNNMLKTLHCADCPESSFTFRRRMQALRWRLYLQMRRISGIPSAASSMETCRGERTSQNAEGNRSGAAC